jgi:sulfopyruvate decarboxylase TPP-binding subunit
MADMPSKGAGSGGERLFRSIQAAKPKLVTGVPDGMLSQTIMLCEASPDFPYIGCAREEECIGVASGAAMAGERAIVMVQNAGLLNSLGAFATMGLRYGLPFCRHRDEQGGAGRSQWL